MHTRPIHKIHLKSVPSTHLWVKEHLHEMNPHELHCVIAEEQTAGRGQQGRLFVCEKGNLYLSFYFTIDATKVAYLSQLLSLSCAEMLKQEGIACFLKWPNDVLIEGKKCAGILCDALANEGKRGVILSIGVNLNMEQAKLATIDQPATSLFVISHRHWDVALFFEKLLAQFVKDLNVLEKKGFAPFVPLYRSYLTFPQKEIQVEQGSHKMVGVFHGIDDEGHLILKTKEGSFITCVSGKIKAGG